MAGADVATIADQSLERLGGRTSILARQRADHARLDRLMARARTTVQEGGIAHQVALRAVARLVFTHAFAEESVLFPAARRVLPEGDPLTRGSRPTTRRSTSWWRSWTARRGRTPGTGS